MPRNKSLKWFVPLILIGALAAAGGWYWRQRKPDAPEYQTVTATRGDLTQVVTATGQLNPVTNVTVGCQISGTISKLYVDFNSPVTNGQLVAEIDAATYRANLQLATAEVANAAAALELAQVNARRAKELFADKLIPQAEFDTAIANLHQAEAMVLSKQASANRAKVDLDRCTITSPVDGIVISRSVDVGQTVAASLSAPTLFTIANDLTKMQIDANVAEADIGSVATGQNIDFTVDAFPYRIFHGNVIQVRNSPVTVQNVVTYDTVIAVSNPDLKLKPGMTANVSVIVAHRDNALTIPNAALRYRPAENGAGKTSRSDSGKKPDHGKTRTVYVLAAGKPQAIPVKTGISDGIATEILEGLKDGDVVITGANGIKKAAAGPANPLGGVRRF